MTKPVNIREICLEILQEITEEEAYSHIVLREVLEKYQYLEKRDRAFISRVVEGTLEHMIQLDYIIEQFSNVPVYNMKPLIRNLLRMSVYQLKYMDSVPDSAACNEAVKLAQRRGFYNLKGFVNGVLRSTARRLSQVRYPDPAKEPLHYLSVKYSFPVWMLEKWLRGDRENLPGFPYGKGNRRALQFAESLQGGNYRISDAGRDQCAAASVS